MIKLRITFTMLIICSLFSGIALAENNDTTDIPSEVKEESILFLNIVMTDNPEEIYRHFDVELKKRRP